jgi:crotonobetainyl-CoA:carnitine CoA-transferase CaiB-like acyl-CoA transferase
LVDRGKEHLRLDLRSAEGLAALRELVPTVDVAVVALPVGDIEAARIGYEELRELNPALVYCDITGFARSPVRDSRSASTCCRG